MHTFSHAAKLALIALSITALASAAPLPRLPPNRPSTRPTTRAHAPATQPDAQTTTQPAAPEGEGKPQPPLEPPKSFGELERQQKALGRWGRGSIQSIKGDTLKFRVPGEKGKPPVTRTLTIDDQTVVLVYTKANKPKNITSDVNTWVRIEKADRSKLRSGTNASISWDEFDRTLVIETGVYVSGDLGVVGSSPAFSMPSRPPPATAPTTQP